MPVRPKLDHVFQLKVTLKDLRPPIWRRLQVPCTYSFWDLHVAIQDAMGWQGCHLHEFEASVPLTREAFLVGIPDEGDPMSEGSALPAWQVPIAGFLTLISRRIGYLYDLGDCWQHTVELERILPIEEQVDYPLCIGGRRACPPEDCGGVPGYEQLLEQGFEEPAFLATEVRFRDPHRALSMAFGEDGDD